MKKNEAVSAQLSEHLIKEILVYLLALITFALTNPVLAGAINLEIGAQIQTQLEAIQRIIDVELSPEPEHASPRTTLVLIGQSSSPSQSRLNQLGGDVAQALITSQASSVSNTNILYPGGDNPSFPDLVPVNYSTSINPKLEILNRISDEIAHGRVIDLFVIGHGDNYFKTGEFSFFVGNFPQPGQQDNYIYLTSSQLADAIASGIAQNKGHKPKINVIILSCHSGASVASLTVEVPNVVVPPGINLDSPSRLTDEVKAALEKLSINEDPEIRVYTPTGPNELSFDDPNFFVHLLETIKSGGTLQKAQMSWTENPHYGQYNHVPYSSRSGGPDDHQRSGLTTQATTFDQTIETKTVVPKEDGLKVVLRVENLQAASTILTTSLIDQSGNIMPVGDSYAFSIPGQSSIPITATLPILLEDSKPFTGTVRFLDQEGRTYDVYFDSRHTVEAAQLLIQSNGTFEVQEVDNQTTVKIPITVLPGFSPIDNYQLRIVVPGDHIISQPISLGPDRQEITFPISLSRYYPGWYNIHKISLWVEIYDQSGKRVWQQLITNDDFNDNLKDASHQPPCELDTIYQEKIVPDVGDVDIYRVPSTDKTLYFSFVNMVPDKSVTGDLVIDLLDSDGVPIESRYIVVKPGKSLTMRLTNKKAIYVKISPSDYRLGDIYPYRFVFTKEKILLLPMIKK